MKRVIPSLLLPVLFFATTHSQPVIAFTTYISGLSSPVDIVNAGDGTNRLFIVQQGGTIRIHNGTSLLPTPFLSVTGIITTGGERGLLSMAFHPDYETNRFFYIYYTNLSGDITIARYQTQAGDPNLADAGSGVVLMNFPKPFSNHNGGDLNFGPDGYLYFATGDGGSGGDPNNFAQTGTSLLGKMIRIDVNNPDPPYYFIPSDNPYVSDPNVDDRIWALGLRNPWRWSFDRVTNDMWIADVGQGGWEEVNFRSAGSTGGINYGWRCYEGNAAYNTTGCLPASNYVFPIFVYPHNFSTGGFSITGGFVYRGSMYPSLQGYYICADYVSGNVWLINPDGLGGWTTRMQDDLPGSISGFGEGENGTLYAVGLNGFVYTVDLVGILPLSLLSFSGTRAAGYNDLNWRTSGEQDLLKYVIEYSTDGIHFQATGEVAARNLPGDQYYSFRHYTTDTRKLFYRLKTEELNGNIVYSRIIALDIDRNGSIRISPNFITDRSLRIQSEKPIREISVVDSYGRLLLTKQFNDQQGQLLMEFPALSSGVYWIRMKSNTGVDVQKIIIGN